MQHFIWFDFGGVLSPPLQELFDSYERKTGIDRKTLEMAMRAVAEPLGVPTLAPVELAMITEREWGAGLRAHLTRIRPDLDLSRARLEEFGAQWFADIEPNRGMVDTLRGYREHGFRVGILSNNVVEWEPHWLRVIADVGEVDALIDSCKVGARKPHPAIFDIADKQAEVPVGRSILIDDLPENCAAAEKFGWTTILFENNDQVRRDLSALVRQP